MTTEITNLDTPKRKLASIRKVTGILPIVGADNIELVQIDGWQCVVKKGEFQPGDLCIYFEIDAFLPVHPEYEFLRKSSFRKLVDGSEGFRIKTVKLRGALSQGLAIPAPKTIDMPECDADGMWHGALKVKLLQEGDDVTELLGVKKWEPAVPAVLSGDAEGVFPGFIPKTDQERIQNLFNKHLRDDSVPFVYDPINAPGVGPSTIPFHKFYKDQEFEVTVKLDGSSMTVYLKDEEYGVCSRNLRWKESDTNTFWKVANRLGLRDLLKDYREDSGYELAIQGELIGPGIQGNREKLIDHEMYIFDIFNITKGRYFTPDERAGFILLAMYEYATTLHHVPILGMRKVFTDFHSSDELLAYAEGPSLVNPVREGLVFKSTDGVVSFKAISNKFLLSEKD